MAATDNACIPFHEPGGRVTGHAAGAITGKRFVAISGDAVDGNPRVVAATAEGDMYAVAGHDAASGEKLTLLKGPGMEVPVTADGAITAGAKVEVGTDGKAKALADGIAVGRAVTGAADGADARIELFTGGGVAAGHTHA